MTKAIKLCTPLAIILFFVIILSSAMGAAHIKFIDSMGIILKNVPIIGSFIGEPTFTATHEKIILSIRLPRILLATLVGMALSVSGAAYQGIFRNPMAEPYVLGVSSGAALGATLAIIFFGEQSIMGYHVITVFAFIGSLITIILVYSLAKFNPRNSIASLLLAGIAISFFLSSFVSILMILNQEAIEKVYLWTMGSVSSASWVKVQSIAPLTLVGTLVILIFSRDLNIMVTGENEAKSLGVNVDVVQKIILFTTALMIAAAVSVSGIIGFVGLIIPHTFRLMFGSDHRILLPVSALGGAIFLVLADTFARTIMPPAELPVGAITALFGAPYFIYLLLRKR